MYPQIEAVELNSSGVSIVGMKYVGWRPKL